MNSTNWTLTWNQAQEYFQCCGGVNKTDWGENIPDSCLVKSKSTSALNGIHILESCDEVEQIKSSLHKNTTE